MPEPVISNKVGDPNSFNEPIEPPKAQELIDVDQQDDDAQMPEEVQKPEQVEKPEEVEKPVEIENPVPEKLIDDKIQVPVDD